MFTDFYKFNIQNLRVVNNFYNTLSADIGYMYCICIYLYIVKQLNTQVGKT